MGLTRISGQGISPENLDRVFMGGTSKGEREHELREKRYVS